MKLEEQVTSLELAKKLKGLGVIQESVFFYEWSGAKELSINEDNEPYFNIDGINAYTASENLEEIPWAINIDGKEYHLEILKRGDSYLIGYRFYDLVVPEDCFLSDALAEAVGLMRVWLIENGHNTPQVMGDIMAKMGGKG